MKTFVPNKLITVCLLVLNFCIVLSASSQVVPQLQFTNAVLESGNAGEDGAAYRFSTVTAGVDAVVEIKGRSSSSVVLSSIDTSGPGLGYDKAFQPVLGIPGVAPALSNWSMDFQLTFYKAGTNSKVKLTQFSATGLDIDGDGMTLSEWTQMKGVQSIDSALINSLTFTKIGQAGHGLEYKVEGIIANSPGIDTTAKNVMATYTYINEDQLDFTIGAKTSILPTTAAMRLNSIWFRSFLGVILPVKLESFTALQDNGHTKLEWVTASEMNVSHFAIEKSYDSKNYIQAGVVKADGNSSTEVKYDFTDDKVESKTCVICYRLKMVDIDGKLEYSPVRTIKFSGKPEADVNMNSFPNPVTSDLHITIPLAWQHKNVSYNFMKANGQIIKQFQTKGESPSETFNINNFAPGIYLVTATCGTEIKTQKIIKS